MIIVDYYRKVTSLKRSLLEKRQLVDSWAIDSAFLVIGKKIGQGSFAEVFQALYFAQLPCTIMQPEIKQDFPSPDEGIMVAVKYAARESEREVLLKEIKIMKSIGYHPHLLSLLGCSEDPIKPLILTEFCTNGDLLTALRSADLSKTTPRVVELSFEDLHRIAWEVASALEFLISRDVIHRDVAARNVLINGAKASKLCDFGLSRDFSNSYYTHHGGKIPVKWTSLEAIECGIYTEASDVWAFGVLLWEMYSHGATPYGDMDADTMLDELKKGFRLEKPQSMPTQIAIIMARCWTTALSRRPNFKEITQGLREFLAIHYH